MGNVASPPLGAQHQQQFCSTSGTPPHSFVLTSGGHPWTPFGARALFGVRLVEDAQVGGVGHTVRVVTHEGEGGDKEGVTQASLSVDLEDILLASVFRRSLATAESDA